MNVAPIKNYFLSSPSQRVELKKEAALCVDSTAAVSFVMEWGLGSAIEAYDGAIALLAQCSDIILAANDEIFNYYNNKYILNNGVAKETFDKWEILIKGIACNQNIEASQRFDSIVKTLPSNCASVPPRWIKSAVIDALVIMSNEISAEKIKTCLTPLASEEEVDEVIRFYAKEALEDLEPRDREK